MVNKRVLQSLLAAPLAMEVASPQVAHACPSSPDDEMIIEYFNQIEFSEDIYVTILDTGTAFDLSLSCPPQETVAFPPRDFRLTMYPADNSTSIECNGGSIVLQKNQMRSLPFCQAEGRTCSFVVILDNRQTQSVYATTEVMVTLTDGNNTFIPNLEPGTLPLCNSTINACLLMDDCPLSDGPTGSISLCETPASCATPPNSASHAYNENVYFSTGKK